ncbi:MAG TPA: DsbC family protein [Steroidobacteraceae bacterium]|nr:DsbC family protein [Steroidobacteraceae bacterium]
MTDRSISPAPPRRPHRLRMLAAALALIAAVALSPERSGAAQPTAAPAPSAAAPAAAPAPASAPAAAPAPTAHASTVSPQYAALATKLQKEFPEYAIDSIRPSGVDGVLEVVFGGDRIIYSDTAGEHIFNGHLFDVAAHRDLTDERLEEVTRIDVRQLPLADAFNLVRGNGKREIYLFEDPDCPYCRKLEGELPKVDDVTLHVFLYPLTSIHPHAYEHALGIWCSKDRAKAWADKMLKGIDPPPAKCANPLDRNLALGEKLHIDGTPTLILANGRPHSGTLTAEELDKLLATVPVH